MANLKYYLGWGGYHHTNQWLVMLLTNAVSDFAITMMQHPNVLENNGFSCHFYYYVSIGLEYKQHIHCDSFHRI